MNKNKNLNLVPFKKGHDDRRNRKGRPPKIPAIDELLAAVMGEEKDGITAAEIILKALRAKAARGDTRAAEILLERSYGKVTQTMDLRTKGSDKLIAEIEIIKTVRHEYADGSSRDQTEGLDKS